MVPYIITIKGVYSMVLLPVCDVDYCFTIYDFGSYGSNNGNGVLANSTFRERLESNWLNLPPDEPLNGCKFSLLPYFLLGDNTLLLKTG